MTVLLSNKPIIGSIAGFFSWLLYILKELLTNDTILKYIAGTGIWLGILIALLTLYLRIMEVRRGIIPLNGKPKSASGKHGRLYYFFVKKPTEKP